MLNPELISIGPLHLRWYGVMAATGVVCAYCLMAKRSKRYGFTSDNISDITFWGMLTALVGARLLYVISFWNEQFAEHPLDAFKIYEGGIVFLGGFALSAFFLFFYCRAKKWDIGNLADLIAPALPFGHAFGRLGCLLNGCCFGFKYEGFCSVHYEQPPYGTFPLQFFSAVCNAVFAAAILWMEKKNLCDKRRFLIYILGYSVGRFILEFGRGDYPESQLWHGLTPAQVTCLWLAPLTIVVWVAINLFKRPAK